jgi:hypothetical protein
MAFMSFGRTESKIPLRYNRIVPLSALEYFHLNDKICEGKDDVEAELLVLISHIVYSRVELIFDTARDMLNQNEIA